MSMPHPVRRVRCLLTPPCSECANCKPAFFGGIPKCRSNKYLDYTERATAANAKYCTSCRKVAEQEKYARYRAKKKANCGAKVVSA